MLDDGDGDGDGEGDGDGDDGDGDHQHHPAQSTHSMRREGEREGSGGRTEGPAQSAAILMVRL